MTDILIIGGGQAGLATAYLLGKAGHDVVVTDAGAHIGDSWRQRWDTLRLFTPAKYSALPGMPFPASSPGHFPTKDEVADYLATYAARFDLPVETGTTVHNVRAAPDGFTVETSRGLRHAPVVVVATGPFQQPLVPALGADLSTEVVQLHSSGYRSPGGLPDGPVLVVGGGNSGVQIAAELSGTRQVTLSVGRRQPAFPARILGVGLFTWLDRLGIVRAPAASRLGRRIRARDPLIGFGPNALRRHGVNVIGRVTRAAGETLWTDDGVGVSPSTVIWATGYRPDYNWLDLPGAVDSSTGLPIHTNGIGAIRGLYFVGLPFQRNRGSALLGWVGEDAAWITGHLSQPLEDPPCPSGPNP